MVVGAIGDAAMGPLIGAMGALKDQIKAAMAFADNAQKASLALGQTFEQTRDSLGPTMEGLRGDINQQFTAGIAGMEAGLQGNTAGVAKLINQQQLTGTAFKATAKAMASLEAGMNLSRTDTNALAESLIETGAEYGVSTDKLVGAIDALKETFPAQKLSGMGKDVMGAVAGLQAELGPSLAGPLNKVMKSVMDTSEEGFATLTKLGLGGVREQLSAAKSESEAREILKKAFVTASDTFKMHTAGSDTFFRKVGIASENLGRGAIDFTVVADAFGDRVKNDMPAQDFADTLQTLKAEALVPFQEAITFAYPLIKDVARVLSGIAVKVGESFKGWVKGLKGGEAIVKKVTLAMLDFAIIGLNAFDKMITKVKILADTWLPKISDAFMSASTAIHFGIIVPLEILKITFNLFMNGLDGILIAINGFNIAVFKAIELISFGAADYSAEINANVEMLSNAVDRIGERNAAMGASVDRIMMTPEKSAELMKNSIKAANADPNLLGNRLLKEMRDNIENDSADSLLAVNKVAKNTEEINNKTPEIETGSEFLGETANMLSESIENILGIGRDTTSEEMLEELKAANMINMNKETGSSPAKAENSLNG